MPKWFLPAVLCLAASVALVVALSPPEPTLLSPTAPRTDPAVPPSTAPDGESPDPASGGDARPLEEQLSAGEPSSLRARLRENPEAMKEAARLLLDPATPPELRALLAIVIGTLPGEKWDGLLAEALARHGADPVFARAALLGLGADRSLEGDDDLFADGDQPYGEEGPGGTGIVVRREIGDPALRAQMAGYLSASSPPVREASAAALRHSLSHRDVRESFLTAIRSEKDDEVAAVLGESLAGYARRAEETERNHILDILFARAGDEGLDAFRFRLENDLHGVPLPDQARAVLTALAAPSRAIGDRSFALTVLAGSAIASGEEAVREVRALLLGILEADGEAAVRDCAARLLVRLPREERTVRALSRAARADPAWNVRYAALTALAGLEEGEAASEILQAALSDPDERVVRQARALLERLR